MSRAIACVSIAGAAVVIIVLLPFAPGEHFRIVPPLHSLGILLGVAGIVLIPIGIAWLVIARKRRAATRVGPLLLLVLPTVSLATKFLLLPGAVSWSRDRAMANAAPMIAAIEAYRQRVGHYRLSLLSELSDYDPGLIGIERYWYEPSGEAYNLIFEQISDVLGTREFVIYNPRGEQNFSAHDSDLLEMSQADIDRQRGWYASQDAGRPNWRRFLLD